ncbi:MAG: hypothetical protein O2U62_04340 [Candidatus Bathyarchaeota archaeon]|jgi:hypothetical protein|nr:hypothetical protein [Candidatus Bathyarchaeota archaeon]
MAQELGFIADMMEERLVKGDLRWLANFTEIYRDYALGDITVPVYAVGSLTEKGFFLSRIFSAFVTPKYKIHFLIHTSHEITVKSLRRLILSCKRKFGTDDWIFIASVQSRPLGKAVRDVVLKLADEKVGLAAYSLTSRSEITTENVLGRSLKKHLKLSEARFEAIHVPDYLKSVAIVFSLGTLFLIALLFFGVRTLNIPLSLLIMLAFSIVVAYPIYKRRYHTVFSLNSKGFKLSKGADHVQGKWSDYRDVSVYITPQHETYIRLYSKKGSFDIPLSRVGLSRKEAYSAIKQILRRE